MTTQNRLQATLIAAMLGCLPAAQAAVWSKTSSAAGSTCNTANGTSCTIVNTASDAGNATVTGWSTAPGAQNTTATNRWRAANLSDQGSSGFGLNHGNTTFDAGEGTSPEHSIDNNGARDGLMYSFGSSTILSSLTVGWWSRDLDITVLRYTGSDAPNLTTWGITGSNTLSGTMTGWELVGNYASVAYGSESSTSSAACQTSGANTASCTQTIGINAGGLASSHWLIMAYSSAFGTGTNLSNGNDYFKLLSVTGAKVPTSQVAEPGALALAGIAGLGLFAARRRQRR